MLAYVSLWSADLLNIGAAVDRISGVADAFHIDVFDGHNVRDLLFGPDFVAALRQRTSVPIDIHLNVTDPDYWATRFIEVGADIVTVQYEASSDIRGSLRAIRSQGARSSVGLEVHEPTSHAEEVFDDVDRVLVMGTVIGVRGLEPESTTPERVAALVRAREARRDRSGPSIVVDGGVRAHSIDALAEAGADGVVPGQLVFGDPDPVAAIHGIHALPGRRWDR